MTATRANSEEFHEQTVGHTIYKIKILFKGV